MSSQLTPNGKSHRVLRLLSEAPAHQWQCADALAVKNATERRKAWYVLMALRNGGLITLSLGLYDLTAEGRNVLARLDAGDAVWIGQAQPSVRVFARDIAA